MIFFLCLQQVKELKEVLSLCTANVTIFWLYLYKWCAHFFAKKMVCEQYIVYINKVLDHLNFSIAEFDFFFFFFAL